MPGVWAATAASLTCLGCLAAVAGIAGRTLNLYLATACLAGAIVPAYLPVCRRLSDSVLLIATAGLSCWIGWICVGHLSMATAWQSGRCALVVGCLLTGAIGAGRLLTGIGWASNYAVALVVSTCLLWLTWPIWTTTAPPLLVRVHPLLAINGVLADDLGVWTEQPVIYLWGVLGQDVPYQLPGSILPSCLAQGLIGVGAMAVGQLIGWWRSRPASA